MRSTLSCLRARGAALTLSALLPLGGYAQSSIASYNGVHAIVGARIEIGDGRVIEKGTVVIRNGVITEVAADAAVPRGADVLDGKGLTVYPGFIDAYTNKGFSLKKPVETAAEPDGPASEYASAFMRQAGRNRIQPQVRAAENLALTDDLLKAYQTAGFTTTLVAPTGEDMSGSAALVNLSGRPSRECLVLADAGATCSFGRGGFGAAYPSSLMGHIAQLRQTFLDAQWYRSLQRSFAAGGVQRPPADDVLIALQPVIGAKMPAIFDADGEYRVQSSLSICSEFGLKPLVAGGTEAWMQIEDLKKSGASVLLSLSFRQDPAPKPEAAKPAAGSNPPPATPPPAIEDMPPTPENPAKVAEKLRLYKESVANAAMLSKAGIPLALSTKGLKSPTEFMENLRKAVGAGLSKEAALRCLTIDSAKIFGIDRQFGTIEAGKTANIVVMTGDFLDAKTKVKTLYIDGRKIEPGRKEASPTPRMDFGTDGGLR